MTPEKIIANIENYISLLPQSEQELYSEYLRLAETNYQSVTEIPCVKNSILKHDPLLELVEIVRELKRDIKEKMQKNTKGKSFVQRSKKLTKIISHKSNIEKFAKGWIEEIKGEQLQVSSYCWCYAFLLKEHLDIPMFTEQEKQEYGYYMKNIIPPYKTEYKPIEFDIADIKAKLTLHKAKKNKDVCKIEIDGAIFNAEYFVNLVEILGENVTIYKRPFRRLGVVVFENDNGIGLLVPIRE